jgi:hypothetical protein
MASTCKTGRFICAAALLLAIGCSGRRGESTDRHEANVEASGTITVDILQSGRPETYWHYEVQPLTGAIRQVSEQHFSDYQHESIPRQYAMPAGAISGCKDVPSSVSPDGIYSAACVEEHSRSGEFSVVYRERFLVRNMKQGATFVNWQPEEHRGIRGFAWSPDSRSVVVLNTDEYYGKGPLEQLSAAAGHPVPHHRILLTFFNVDNGQRTEYEVRREVINAFTRILSWN